MSLASANFPATLPIESGQWQLPTRGFSNRLLTGSDPSGDRRGQRNALRFALEGELLLDRASFQWIDGEHVPQTYDAVEAAGIEGITPAARSAVAAYQTQIAMGNSAGAKPGRLIDDYA
jgi:hypothetical protein